MTDDVDALNWTLTAPQVGLVTLLVEGALDPLDGFPTPEELAEIRGRRRLPDGTAWAGEPVLEVDPDVAAAGLEAGRLVLRTEDGTPLARLAVDAVHREDDGRALVGGALTPLGRPPALAFPELHRSRSEVRGRLECAGPVTAVQPSTVPDVATLERWRHHLEDRGGCLLVQPTIAAAPDEDWACLVRAHRRAIAHLPAERSVLQLLPLPRDGEVVDAATLRALVAANHGATRLLDAPGVDPDVARAHGLHLEPLPVPPTGPWHDDVQEELAPLDEPHRRGTVVLLTGLSGSGKSTIARALRGRLLERGGHSVTLLDGDLVRRTLSSGLGFSREDRETNVRRIGWVAAEIARHGGIAICAPIAPEARVRQAVRQDVEAAGGRFLLVHVATPLEVCEQRDVKGLYARARAGALRGLTGVDAPYEVPTDADVEIDTAGVAVDEAAQRLMDALESG